MVVTGTGTLGMVVGVLETGGTGVVWETGAGTVLTGVLGMVGVLETTGAETVGTVVYLGW